MIDDLLSNISSALALAVQNALPSDHQFLRFAFFSDNESSKNEKNLVAELGTSDTKAIGVR